MSLITGEELLDVAVVSRTDFETKQRKKEEGRRRALEISISRQILPGDEHCTKIESGKRANRNSTRHGARNQHRHRHFAQWILKTFPHVLVECLDSNNANVNDQQCHPRTGEDSSFNTPRSRRSRHILDVAGGKGELSARLSLCHSLRVVMVDPRPADIESVYT